LGVVCGVFIVCFLVREVEDVAKLIVLLAGNNKNMRHPDTRTYQRQDGHHHYHHHHHHQLSSSSSSSSIIIIIIINIITITSFLLSQLFSLLYTFFYNTSDHCDDAGSSPTLVVSTKQ
jgi:hypothetical protein